MFTSPHNQLVRVIIWAMFVKLFINMRACEQSI